MKKLTAILTGKKVKNGSYSLGITALVIVMIVLLNLILGKLPERFASIDLSSTNLYEISDTSKDILGELDKDVKFTILAVKGDTDERITKFIDKYTELSDHLEVEWIDPQLHPTSLTDYGVDSNTIVVSCEDTGKSMNVLFSDIIQYDEYAYYYYGTQTESAFDAEGQLTGAVNFVTSTDNYKIYMTDGHGEASVSDTIKDLMDKNAYEYESVNTMMNEIPEDCDLLFLNAPTTDLSDDEKESFSTYLNEGGKMIMLWNGDTLPSEMPNLTSLLASYGMTMEEGLIADAERCYQQNPYYIFPTLSLTEELANGISSQMTLLINDRGMTITDPDNENVTVTSFMTTSTNGYCVTSEEQKQGQYVIGATAADETTGTKLTVITSASMIDEQITSAFSTLENTTLFMNAVAANFDGSSNLAIEAKSLEISNNTVNHAGLFSLLVIFGLPLLVLIAGFVTWYKRRKA